MLCCHRSGRAERTAEQTAEQTAKKTSAAAVARGAEILKPSILHFAFIDNMIQKVSSSLRKLAYHLTELKQE